MAWCISDVEHGFDTVSVPKKAKSFVEATLDILWWIVSSRRLLLVNFGFDEVNVLSEIGDVKAQIAICDVSVGNESHSDFESCVLCLDGVNDLAQCFF